MFLPDIHGVYPLFPFSRNNQSKLKDLTSVLGLLQDLPLGSPPALSFDPMFLTCLSLL